MFEIVFSGIFVGFLSGFFGIGGGTILIPILLYIGYDIKSAVGVSTMQMVFSSLYGSYLNNKNCNIIALCDCWLVNVYRILFLLNYNHISVPSVCVKSGGLVFYYNKNLKIDILEPSITQTNSKTGILALNI
mgnify:CR=1 FL=1